MLSRVEVWYDKAGKIIIHSSIFLFIVYVLFNYMLEVAAPFIVAWGLASLLNPAVTWLKRTAKVPRGLGTVLSMLTILSSVFGVITILFRQLWQQIVTFAENFPYYQKQVILMIPILEKRLEQLQDAAPFPETLSTLDGILNELLSSVGNFIQTLIAWVYDIASKLPNVIIFIVVVLIGTFFMTRDYEMIKSFVKAQVPQKTSDRLRMLQERLLGALGGYIRTQLIMMSIVFIICLGGLLIIHAPYVFLISLCIAVFDALPVFGSGAILMPWAIYSMIIGDYSTGMGLLTIYGIIFLARQMIEPRILSGQIGLYSLVTIMAMYAGYKVIGVLGLIIGPISIIILLTFQKTGMLPSFKSVEEEHSKAHEKIFTSS